MESVTKWLPDPDTDKTPFPHKIGERLRSPSKNLEGIVRNAKYAGTENGESAWITYYIETDTGEIIQLPSAELEKVGQPIQLPLALDLLTMGHTPFISIDSYTQECYPIFLKRLCHHLVIRTPKVWENFTQGCLEKAFEKLAKELRGFRIIGIKKPNL